MGACMSTSLTISENTTKTIEFNNTSFPTVLTVVNGTDINNNSHIIGISPRNEIISDL